MLEKTVAYIIVVILVFMSIIPLGTPVFAATLSIIQTNTGNIFCTSEPVQFNVNTDAKSIRYHVYDYWDDEIATGILPVSGTSVTLEIPMTRKGSFKLLIDAMSDDIVINTVTTTFARIDELDISMVSETSPFMVQTHMAKNGVMASWSDMNTVVALTKKMGFKTVRNNLRWNEIEDTVKGQYNFKPMHDDFMKLLQDNDMELFFTAAFSDNFYTTWTDEYNTGFANYVAAVINRYPGRIKWVEVGNEFNTDLMGPPGTADEKAAIYFKLLKEVYNKVKNIDPSIKVVGGATNEIGTSFFSGIFSRGGLAYCDAISYHEYTPEPLDTAYYYTTIDNLVKTYNNNASIPILLTECGYSTYSTSAPEESDGSKNREQARYMVLRIMSAVANFKAGNGLVNYYELLNDTADRTNNEDNFGTFRAVDDPLGKYTPRWSYGTMAAMTRQMKDAVYSSSSDISGGVKGYLFNKNGQHLRFLYSVFGKYTVTADATTTITVTDMMGNSTSINPVGGKVTFDLSESPVYVSGEITNPTSTAANKNYIHEAESLTSRGSDSRSVAADSNFSRASGSKFNGNAIGDYVEYDVTVPMTGTYDLRVRQKVGTSRGKSQLKVDGNNVGVPYDSYDSSNYAKINNFGNITFSTTGTHTIRFDITGKNSSSSDYSLLIDGFNLVYEPVQGVGLYCKNMILAEGGAVGQLTATVLPVNAVNKNLIWVSDNPAVASINSGSVTPVARGTATITVKTVEGNYSDTCLVTVKPLVNKKFDIQADTYTQNVSADWWYKNYGTLATELYTRNKSGGLNDRKIYMKVDCSAITDLSSVKSAKLYLYGIEKETSDGNVMCYGLTDDSWTETGVSYKTPVDPIAYPTTFGPPSENGKTLLSSVFYNAINTWYSFDVTNFLKTQSDKILSFKIDGDPNGKMFKFAPREYTTIDKRPYLEVDYYTWQLVQQPQYTYKDALGNLLEGFSDGGSVTIKATVKLNSANIIPSEVTMISGLYERTTGKLVGVSVDRNSISGGESIQLTCKLDALPANASNYILKNFFMDSINGLKPLLTPVITNP